MARIWRSGCISKSQRILCVSLLLSLSLPVLHTSFSWWSFIGVWVTANLFRYQGHLWVFLPIPTMHVSKWLRLFLNFPFVPIPYPSFWRLFHAHQLQLVSPLHLFSYFLERFKYLYILSISFVTLWSGGTVKSIWWKFLFFSFTVIKAWSSGWDWMMCLHLKITENVLRRIFLDRFRLLDIPFNSMVKVSSLAQFPVDHLSHPIVPFLLLVLCQFTAFAFYVINCFISVST